MKEFVTLITLLPLLFLASCQTQLAKKQQDEHEVIQTIHGEASWYEIKCNGGTQTASGIPLKDHAMTAAHKTLPMGTKVRVTNKRNGKSVIVKITDRGPYIKGRVIDLTKGAAKKIDLIQRGISPCKVEVLIEKKDSDDKKHA
jgi:rare lipoprotein A